LSADILAACRLDSSRIEPLSLRTYSFLRPPMVPTILRPTRIPRTPLTGIRRLTPILLSRHRQHSEALMIVDTSKDILAATRRPRRSSAASATKKIRHPVTSRAKKAVKAGSSLAAACHRLTFKITDQKYRQILIWRSLKTASSSTQSLGRYKLRAASTTSVPASRVPLRTSHAPIYLR